MLNNKLIAAIVFCIIGLQAHGQFNIGQVTVTYTDSSRNNRSIPTEIYYPADVQGTNVPLTTSVADSFPVLVFGHGFVMAWSAYANVWEYVVPSGYIIAFPKTETGLSPNHSTFANDIAFIVSQLQAEALNPNSIFYNRVALTSAAMGHSMGGGSSLLAYSFNPSITAIANLAPAETNPSAISACAGISIPTLIISGENDCVTPPATNQIPMYNALTSPCKTYVEIKGGDHCKMANGNFFCELGQSSCQPQATISDSTQHVIMERYLLPWLDFYLKNNCTAGAWFDSTIIADNEINFQKSCTLCSNPQGISTNGNIPFQFFTEGNTWHVKSNNKQPCNVVVSDLTGRVLFKQVFVGQIDQSITDYATGLYLISISNQTISRSYKFLINR
ncbi:MAG: T9SS type A sorting domain-containing protein [Bacteroidetes bacterium]|nr:T9SS type A sorting domain-containing protein [Bacteroidota bacterium]